MRRNPDISKQQALTPPSVKQHRDSRSFDLVITPASTTSALTLSQSINSVSSFGTSSLTSPVLTSSESKPCHHNSHTRLILQRRYRRFEKICSGFRSGFRSGTASWVADYYFFLSWWTSSLKGRHWRVVNLQLMLASMNVPSTAGVIEPNPNSPTSTQVLIKMLRWMVTLHTTRHLTHTIAYLIQHSFSLHVPCSRFPYMTFLRSISSNYPSPLSNLLLTWLNPSFPIGKPTSVSFIFTVSRKCT